MTSPSLPAGGVTGASASSLDADALSFLASYATTQRFRAGLPNTFNISPLGDCIYFLRTESERSMQQNLYMLQVTSGEETVLMRASGLVSLAEEKMSDEERKLRERKRMTSKGLLSYALCPCASNLILIPFQQHLYLLDKNTMSVLNITSGSRFEEHGPPAYPLFSPDGKKVAFVRKGDIFIIELASVRVGAGAAQGTAAAPAAAASAVPAPGAPAAGAAQTHFEYRLTFTGTASDPHCENGVADFIAQEELGRFRGMWWSPSSEALCYQSTDTRGVENLSIADLASPNNPPTFNAYPRPGHPNAKVRLGVLTLEKHHFEGAASEDATMADDSADTNAAGTDGSASKKRRRVSSSGASVPAGDPTDATPATPVAHGPPETTWIEWDAGQFPYVATVVWDCAAAPLSIVVQNRLQTESVILACADPLSSGRTSVLHRENDPSGAWVNLDHSCPHWLEDGKHFLWSGVATASSTAASPSSSAQQQQAEEGGWEALFLHSAAGQRLRVLHDPATVQYRKTLKVDEAAGVCYILGGAATEQHVFRVPLGVSEDAASQPSSATAPATSQTTVKHSHPGLATQLTSSAAVHSAVFSTKVGVWVHVVSNLQGERYFVRRLPPKEQEVIGSHDQKSALSSSVGSARALPESSDPDGLKGAGVVLAEVKAVARLVPANRMPNVTITSIVASEKLALEELALSDALIAQDKERNPLTAALNKLVPKKSSVLEHADPPAQGEPKDLKYNLAIVKPHSFDANKKYPVVTYVYGGPGHRLVTRDRGTWLIAQLVADSTDSVVVTIDNRGTPCRGSTWEKAIRGDFQECPLRDQVAALKALAKKEAYLDLSVGVGIYGWSFGGYMSALAVMRYPSFYHAAFVGAPVADWRWYDTCYTERVLGLPLEKEADYERSSVLTYAPNLLRPLLLVHGATDDNVYFAHAVQMSAEMFKWGRHHEMLVLAGTHMLADPLGTLTMYERLCRFMGQHIHRRA